jgi:predicted small integral membrane protein
VASDEITAEGSVSQKATIFQTIAAMVAGMIAVKVSTYIVTTLWRLVTREDPPQIDMNVPVAKKAAWVGLVGAASGAARQAARDLIKPPSEDPA